MTSTYTGSGVKVPQMQLQNGRLRQFCTINLDQMQTKGKREGENFQDILQTSFKYGPKCVCYLLLIYVNLRKVQYQVVPLVALSSSERNILKDKEELFHGQLSSVVRRQDISVSLSLM